MTSLYELSIFAVKPLIVLMVLLVLIRILGKRTTAQLSVYDLAMIVALSNAVQNAMTAGRGEVSIGVVAAGVLMLASAAITWIASRNPLGQRLLVGSPTIVLSNGRVLRSRLKRELLTEEELMAALRAHGLSDPSQAQMAVLEVDGTLSIVPKHV